MSNETRTSEDRKAKDRDRKAHRIANGWCTRCGKPSKRIPECVRCLRKRSLYYHANYKLQPQPVVPSGTTCQLCPSPAVGPRFCQKHLEMQRKYARDSSRRKLGREPRPRLPFTCGFCGKTGHTARSCQGRRAHSVP